MEARTIRGSLDKEKQGKGILGFRSSKQLLQQLRRPGDGKKQPLSAQFQNKDHHPWPPVHSSKLSKKGLQERLPERLLLLEEFYNAMEAAISLLCIRRSVCSFSAIAKAVESSTHRRFLQSHLAQMKHILPETLQVDELISWDAESQCSRRDLRVTLLPIPREGDDSVHRCKSPEKITEMVARRREFHRRLLKFAHGKTRDDMDVPQASILDRDSASGYGESNARPLKPSLTLSDSCLEAERELCQREKQGRASECGHAALSDSDLLQSCELDPTLPPLPVAFHSSQLKKYPRSPSKLPQQHHLSPPPLQATMSHLPPVFKRHFSARRPTDTNGREESSQLAPEPATVMGSMASFRPQISLKHCKNATPSSNPRTPKKVPPHPTTPQKRLAECHASSSPSHADAIQTSSLMSPPSRPTAIGESQCQTPAPTMCSVLSNPFLSPLKFTPVSTPHQAIFTPLASPSPAAGAPTKASLDIPVKRQKQAVIKSLRFGTPSKQEVHGSVYHASMEIKEATPSLFQDLRLASILSPTKNPANCISSVTPKKAISNVSRMLAFNSPGRLQCREVPQAISHDDGLHTPKRTKLCFGQSLELEPPIMNHDSTNAGIVCSQSETLHVVPGKYQCQRTGFVDLSSMNGADKLSASDVEILKCLPQKLLDDVQAKERKQLDDTQSGLEKARRQQQLIAGLPKLFNMVRLIFQSGNRTVLTRKNLLQMVLSSHPDITDQGEIVEQLQLLVDLAPEWISASRSSTGDLLYRINKNANMRAVSKALTEAK